MNDAWKFSVVENDPLVSRWGLTPNDHCKPLLDFDLVPFGAY